MSLHVGLGKLGRALGLLSLAGVLALALLLAATWIEHRIPMELPKPSGPFAVGRTTFHWTDPGHADEFAPVAGTPRELVAWVWYRRRPEAAGLRRNTCRTPGVRVSPATAES